MPEEVIYYVTRYGYLAIFLLIFLQETGMPNPFPNELLLIFSGYLSFKGLLFLPYVILTAISADFIGTNILYFLFYLSGAFIMQKKPKWLPFSDSLVFRLSDKISKGGQWSIYIFRLTPFTRGYTSVITGLMQIRPGVFLPIAFISGLSWAAIYVVTGYYIGPSWNLFIESIENFKYIMISIPTVILCITIIGYFGRKRKRSKINSDTISV
jgi:membrane protein DedA with SNARE-associated domain